jgi:hypothetical protein
VQLPLTSFDSSGQSGGYARPPFTRTVGRHRAKASRCFLLAATSAEMWSQPARGAEFFDDGAFDTGGLRGKFTDWWRHWEKQSYRPPATIPLKLTTTAVIRAAFLAGGAPWELRLALVGLDGDEWYSWPSCLPQAVA